MALPVGITKTYARGRWTGYRVFVRVRLGRKTSKLQTKRFGPDATLAEMKAWREQQRVEARARLGPIPEPHTLAADIERGLDQMRAMPTYAWRKRDLYAWRDVFGHLARSALTAGMIRAQLHAWRTSGPVMVYLPRSKTYKTKTAPLSASACNHRRTALLHLFTLLDGKGADNPVRDVPPFPEPPPQPRAQDLALLDTAIGRMKNPKMQARARVLLWTGIRGRSELGKMSAAHVDLERKECYVPTGKGGTKFRVVPLNDRGVDAWQAFIAAKAWGSYDKDILRKSVRAACRAEAKARGQQLQPVKTYDLRHSIATAYLRAGADLSDVQELLGHTTPRMTRRYAPFHAGKLRSAGERLQDAVTSDRASRNSSDG